MTVQKFLTLDTSTPPYVEAETQVKDTDVSGTTAGAVPYVDSTNTLAEDSANLFWDATNKRLGVGTNTPGAALDVTGVNSLLQTSSTGFVSRRCSANAGGAGATLQKSRGNVATPTVVLTNDTLGSFTFSGYDGVSLFRAAATINATVIETTPSATAMGGRLTMNVCAIGSVALTEVARFDTATGMSMFGANPVIDANRLHILRGYTVATLPAAPAQGATAFVTDALAPAFLAIIVGGGTVVAPVFFNGTNWVGM